MESIALPIRVLEYMGLKTLLITSAVGSMRTEIRPGHFTAIADHINLMGRNPLRAFHEEEFGEMFPDRLEQSLKRLSSQYGDRVTVKNLQDETAGGRAK